MFLFKWLVIHENGWSMKLFPKSYECICITCHDSSSLKCFMALLHRSTESLVSSEAVTPIFAQQIADVDALHMLKKTPPVYSIVSFWDEGPSEPHVSGLSLSIHFCERSPSQSSSWWCNAKSVLLSSQGWFIINFIWDEILTQNFSQPQLLWLAELDTSPAALEHRTASHCMDFI